MARTKGADAVRRGGSFMNDRYRVRMDVTPPATDDGAPHYKITELLDFTPAERPDISRIEEKTSGTQAKAKSSKRS
jgi:hypothetical protein